jgi:putative transposase
MSFRLVRDLAASGTPVAVACRVLAVSSSGYYEWRGRAPSSRAVADAALSRQIVEIHTMRAGVTACPGCTSSSGSDAGCAVVASASRV